MRLVGRLPQRLLVRAEADKETPHALLRDAVVRRVHQLERHPVLSRGAGLQLPFPQPRQMIAPLLLRLPGQRRKLQLQQDVVELIGEGDARHALQVLKHECARMLLAHGAYSLREHIALVQEAAMLTAHRERPAGRPAGDQVDALESAVLEILDVAVRHIRPMVDRIDLVLVGTQ